MKRNVFVGGDFRRILFRVLNPNFRKGKRKEERLLLFAVIKVNTLCILLKLFLCIDQGEA